MKILLRFLFVIQVSFVLSGCWGYGREDDYVPESSYEPVIVTRAELESSVAALPAREVIKSGKIYIKDHLMFVNEVNAGFHVYNYSDASNPVKIGFIRIVGATDLAMRSNVIYINQAVDLVTMTYNPNNNTINVTNRNRNVFPQKDDPDGVIIQAGTEDTIIIDWIPKN